MQLEVLVAAELGQQTLPRVFAGLFLQALSRRFARRGFSATRLHLTMTRTDIANYLRLAPETVSRVLKRLQDEGLVRVDRRELEILDMTRIQALALNVLRH